MSYVVAQLPAFAAAATELTGIGSVIGEAAAAAAMPTTGIMSAAADEVSAAIANLFGGFGLDFQTINSQFGGFYEGLVQRLTTTVESYANAEAINTAALVQGATGGLATPIPGPTSGLSTAIIMGGTGMPIPTPTYLTAIRNLFLPSFLPSAISSLVTPEQLYPITGVRSLPLATSVQQGLQILNTAVGDQLAAGNHVTVFGYSQSAIISSLLMQHYISLGPNMPDPSLLNFILTGNEMNPNGGILARIPGLNISTIGLPFYGATYRRSLSHDDLHARIRRLRRLPALPTQFRLRPQRRFRNPAPSTPPMRTSRPHRLHRPRCCRPRVRRTTSTT